MRKRLAVLALALLLVGCSGGGGGPPMPPPRPPTINYGAGQATVCQPVGKATAVLFIHGGGWTQGSRNDGILGPCMSMPETVSAISIDYRLAPQSKWPAQLEDAKAAVAYLRSHGATRVCAWGISAGAHIAAWLAVQGVVDCAVGESTPTDLATCCNGQSVASDARAASPVHFVTPASAPLYLTSATRDTIVPLGNGEAMVVAYRAQGRDITNVVYPGGHVYQGVATADRDRVRAAATAWMLR